MAFLSSPRVGQLFMPEQFSLKRGVKAFSCCIVQCISDKAHGAQYASFPHPVGEDDRGVLKTLGLEWWITPLWGCLRLMAMFRAHTANSDVIRLPIDQPITLLEKASNTMAKYS